MAETKLNEPNMNTIAAVNWLEKNVNEYLVQLLATVLPRQKFKDLIRRYCVIEGPFNEATAIWVDWDYVVDAVFIHSLEIDEDGE